ncbi:hypothetical protein M0R45_011656 [Rubus argutus]|uniref:FAS1 domain-containing protein n=1 Tax=Rubus argutus TaxID=59490 RepID=A0AAW1YDN0_RUBAR
METNKTKASMFFFLLIISSTMCTAFNITKLLDKESDFSSFNQYLSQTKLADQINKRSTITVLVVDNGAIGGLPGDDSFVLKSIMSVHVILDYYDKDKLTKLAKHNRSATLTSLFQTSGLAKNQQGFVRVGADDGEITFGSASKDAQMNSKLVKSVTAQPYNISVLQVSAIIEVPNINASPSPEKAPAPKKGKPPSPSDEDEADSPADDTSDSDDDAEKAPSPSKPKHRTPPKPDEDDTVTSDSPSSTPAPAPSSSRASAAEMGFGAVVMGLISVLVAFF